MSFNSWRDTKMYIYYVSCQRISIMIDVLMTLRWRHNKRHGVSNHLCLDCLPNRLLRRRSKKTSKLRVAGFVRGIHRWSVDSSHKGPVTRKMFPFDDVIMMFKRGYKCTHGRYTSYISFRREKYIIFHSCFESNPNVYNSTRWKIMICTGLKRKGTAS